MKKWINLEKYGIELKKVIVRESKPNESVFPVIVVVDQDKYNNSGATPLSELNNINNSTGFIRLSGERKGRDTNTPIYMLSKSFHKGVAEYDLRESLSHLLNISTKEVQQHYKEQDESTFEVRDGYANFEQFDKNVQAVTQRFFGNRLYIVEKKGSPQSLISLADQLIENQHPLFPKSTVSNIPFQELDAFGFNSNIVERAFTNPSDALKRGYSLRKLKVVNLEANYAVLPISVNSDNSINLILDADQIPNLAYSNHKWQKNVGLIEDYNALISLREASKNILNLRETNIKNNKDMENHLEKLSLSFQNYNAAQLTNKLHKPIKFNEDGVYIYILKNREGDWRFIEKEGFNKSDQPLNWSNYKKAIEKLIDHHNLISESLGIENLTKDEKDVALSKILKNQIGVFEKHVQVLRDDSDIPKYDKVIISGNGKKMPMPEFNTTTKNFKRDLGQNLQTQRIQSFINELQGVQDGDSIFNSMGTVVEYSDLLKTVETIDATSNDDDILNIFERNIDDSSNIRENLDFEVQPIKISSFNANYNQEKEENRIEFLIDTSKYNDLPKGISEIIDQNYQEANKVFQSLQHIHLSSLPYWERQLEETIKLRNESYAVIFEKFDVQVSAAIKNNLDSSDVQMNSQDQSRLNNADETLNKITEYLDAERIKANILSYQFDKLTNKSDSQLFGNLVFNKDDDGNFIPFQSQVEYNNALQLVKNKFDKDNAQNGSLILDQSETRKSIDSFIDENYSYTSGNKEAIDLWNSVVLFNNESQNNLSVELDDVDLTTDQLTVELKNNLFNKVNNEIHESLNDYINGNKDSLNHGLRKISELFAAIEDQSFITLHTDSIYLDKILKSYKIDDSELAVKDPLSGIELSDKTKIDALKKLASLSFKNISNLDQQDLKNSKFIIGGDFAKAYSQNDRNFENLNVSEYQRKLAARFLLINRENPYLTNSGEQNFELSISVDDQPYKIRIHTNNKNKEKIDGGVIVLKSKNFSDAKLEAFSIYQTYSIGSMLGLSAKQIKSAKNIAEMLVNNTDGITKVTQKVFGYPFTSNDLKGMNVTDLEKDKLTSNIKMSIITPDSGDIPVAPLVGKGVANLAAFTLKLGSINSKIKNELVDTLGDYTVYKQIESYINPDHVEAYSVRNEIKSYPPTGKELASMSAIMTEHTLKAYNDAHEFNFEMEKKCIVTNIPTQSNSFPTSRILPVSWLEGINKNEFNITNLPEINESVALSLNIAKKVIEYHINEGDVVSSKPVLAQSILFDVEANIKEDVSQNKILERGFNDNKYDYFRVGVELALSNLSVRLKDQIINNVDSDENIKIGLLNRKYNQPLISINSVYHPVKDGYIPIMEMSINELTRNIKEFSNSGYESDGRFKLDISDLKQNLALSKLFHHVEKEIVSGNESEFTSLEQAVVHNLKPISVKNESISEDFIVLARQGFIQQFEKMTENVKEFNIDARKVIDRAGIYTMNNGEMTIISMSADKIKSQKLQSEGFIPLMDPSGSFNGKNLFWQISNNQVNELSNSNLINVLQTLPISKKIDKPTVVSIVAPFQNEEQTINTISAESEKISSYKTAIDTKFVEVFDTNLSTDSIVHLKSVTIKDRVRLEVMWPKKEMQEHISSQHQDLDAIILGKTIRDILPESAELDSTGSYAAKASGYYYMIKEIFNTVSKSRSVDDLLDNFPKSVQKINLYDIDLINQSNPNSGLKNDFGYVADFLTRAKYYINSENMDSSDALIKAHNFVYGENQSLFSKKFNLNVEKMADCENIIDGEISFINYLKGFTLNVDSKNKLDLDYKLRSRMLPDRNNVLNDLSNYESESVFINEDLKNKINGKSPIAINDQIGIDLIKDKWGIPVFIDEKLSMFERSLTIKTNEYLEKLQNALKGKGDYNVSPVGLNIRFSNTNKNTQDIVVNNDTTLEDFKNSWVNSVFAIIEKNEYSVMSDSEKLKYAEFAKKNNSILGFAVSSEYEPKTESLRNLIGIYDLLKDGVDKSFIKDSERLLVNANLVESERELNFSEIQSKSDAVTKLFTNEFVQKMSDRQDVVLKQIESKIEKISQGGLENDPYAFSSVNDLLDKAMTPQIIASKVVLNKFAEQIKNNIEIIDSGLSKDNIIDQLTDKISNAVSVPEFESAFDLLQARAANQFIKLLDKYVSEKVKDSDLYINQINQYFNLGDSSKIDGMNLKSEFAIALVNKEGKSFENFVEQLKPDIIVGRFVCEVLSSSNSTLLNNTSELDIGLKSIGLITSSLEQDTSKNVLNKEVQKEKFIGSSIEL